MDEVGEETDDPVTPPEDPEDPEAPESPDLLETPLGWDAADLSCASDGDCGFGLLSAGNCTLSKTRECFLDSIRTDGVAIPGAPLVGSVFCIAPVSSAGVNAAAGLPGPGRVLQQVSSTLFCANDHSRIYTPGDPSSCE